MSPQLALPERNELLSINASRRPTDRPKFVPTTSSLIWHYAELITSDFFLPQYLIFIGIRNKTSVVKKYVHVRYFKTCGFSSLPPPSPTTQSSGGTRPSSVKPKSVMDKVSFFSLQVRVSCETMPCFFKRS